MAATVLGKRSRGALQTEGTTRVPGLPHHVVRLSDTNDIRYSTCITSTHFQQASVADTSHSSRGGSVFGIVTTPIAFPGEEEQFDRRRK